MCLWSFSGRRVSGFHEYNVAIALPLFLMHSLLGAVLQTLLSLDGSPLALSALWAPPRLTDSPLLQAPQFPLSPPPARSHSPGPPCPSRRVRMGVRRASGCIPRRGLLVAGYQDIKWGWLLPHTLPQSPLPPTVPGGDLHPTVSQSLLL